MDSHWKELLPVDRYQVQAHGLMHDFYRKTVTTLYQPLIGAVAYSLYMTLWSQIPSEIKWSEETTHRSLMNITQLDLKELLIGRKKLEAIGLLYSFVKEKNDARVFYYQLEVPLSPEQFFNDGALNVYLYNRLGHHQFQQIKKDFLTSSPEIDDKTKQVTASFNDVFQSLHPSELVVKASSEMERAMQLDNGKAYVGESSGSSIRMSEDFDLEWLQQSLSNLIVPDHIFTSEIIETIKKLAYIYQIEPLQMKHIIESTYIKDDNITDESLRKATHEWYALQHNNQLPHLSLRVQPPLYQNREIKEANTEEEKAIQLFDTISPFELLEQMAGGAKPAASDIKIVEVTMIDQKLPPGVVNVLIEYVMRTNDMKLARSLVEKIAAHWARKNVKTVKEAMELAQQEHRKYQEWTNNRNRTTKKKPKNERKDTLPTWISQTNEKNQPNVQDFDQKKKQLEARLRKYNNEQKI